MHYHTALHTMHRQEYLLILSGSEYREGKAKNCVCTYCRTLIYETFDELRSYIEMIPLPDDMRKRFMNWSHIAQRVSTAHNAAFLTTDERSPNPNSTSLLSSPLMI